MILKLTNRKKYPLPSVGDVAVIYKILGTKGYNLIGKIAHSLITDIAQQNNMSASENFSELNEISTPSSPVS